MAEELHDLVTWGRVRIRRRQAWQRTTRGDILEGNTLVCAGKAYLIRVFEKLTDGYLRYGIHRPSDAEFAAACATYQYRPRTGQFDLEVPRPTAPGPATGAPVPTRAPAGRAPATVPATVPVPVPVPVPDAGPRPRDPVVVARNPPQAPTGTSVVLTPQKRLRFLRAEIDGLRPATILELQIKHPTGTTSDPRRLDLLFRCTVAQFATFFDLDTDRDWNQNGAHSWPRFPKWAEAFIVEGTLDA